MVVFAGPTISGPELTSIPDLELRGPVSQGDVYRLVSQHPWAIGIIDGTFEREPAVWHKELLWAMSQGIHVYGSASMGALRAAELASFGMVGVGEIYRAFAEGHLEGDDEVAVAHAGAEHAYRSSSEALINVRFTLRAAVAARVISAELGSALEDRAQEMWYPPRIWPALLAESAGAGEDAAALAALVAWLPAGRIDQKRRDAVEMLTRMERHRATDPSPLSVPWHFEPTFAWDSMTRSLSRHAPVPTDPGGPWRLLEDELRLLGEAAYSGAVQGALLRGMAAAEARRAGLTVTPLLRQEVADTLRRELGLRDAAATHAWLSDRGIDAEAFAALAAREAPLRWIRAVYEPLIAENLVDDATLRPETSQLARRALHKERTLSARGLDSQALSDTGLDEQGLLAWYFQTCAGVPVPQDLSAWALRLGLSSPEALLPVLVREWWFRKLTA
jgi:hypothetical protein